jgi:hypothetical protein
MHEQSREGAELCDLASRDLRQPNARDGRAEGPADEAQGRAVNEHGARRNAGPAA